jgi:hypothetical protein
VINKIVNGPIGLAFDSDCNLWVTNNAGFVEEFVPPYNAQQHMIIGNLNSPVSIAFDAQDNIFIGLVPRTGAGAVLEYPPPGNPIATITQGVYQPWGLAVDAHQDLFVSNYGASNITEYVPR